MFFFFLKIGLVQKFYKIRLPLFQQHWVMLEAKFFQSRLNYNSIGEMSETFLTFPTITMKRVCAMHLRQMVPLPLSKSSSVCMKRLSKQ